MFGGAAFSGLPDRLYLWRLEAVGMITPLKRRIRLALFRSSRGEHPTVGRHRTDAARERLTAWRRPARPGWLSFWALHLRGNPAEQFV